VTAAQHEAKIARRRVALVSAMAVIVTAAAVGAGVWWATRPPAPRVTRLTIASPASTTLSINGVDRDLAITPDGQRVIYVAGTQVFVRALDALDPISVC